MEEGRGGKEGRVWEKKVKCIVAYLLSEMFNASAIYLHKGRLPSGERGQIYSTPQATGGSKVDEET